MVLDPPMPFLLSPGVETFGRFTPTSGTPATQTGAVPAPGVPSQKAVLLKIPSGWRIGTVQSKNLLSFLNTTIGTVGCTWLENIGYEIRGGTGAWPSALSAWKRST